MYSTAIIALTGAVIGSFSMMLYASTHFANVAGPGNTPPPVAAAVLGGYSDQDRIVSAVRRVEPSVVALNVTVNGSQVVPTDPFSQFFGGSGGGGSILRRFHARASGSGFMYSKDGLIVTNAHVVDHASTIQVVFQNGDRVTGHLYASDAAIDLALVKVDGYAKLPPPLELGDSDKLAQGQWAIAIGEPLELKQTVTVGVVSGFNRDETIEGENGIPHEFKGLMQTSAPINPGNSGGPLVDVDGRVIGVNQSTASPQFAQGIGFAIPVNQMKLTLAELVKNPGSHMAASNGFLGVILIPLDGNVRQQINYLGSGVAVANVVSGSAADQAGLEPGDVIQTVDGKYVRTPSDVTRMISGDKVGQAVTLGIWAGGNHQEVHVKIGERPVDTP